METTPHPVPPAPRSFLRIEGGVRHYDWGERQSDGRIPAIADLLGEKAGDKPWAELWLGAHPSLPSQAALADGRTMPLTEMFQADAGAWLGKRFAAAGTLPFLLKVLACSHPLSIQSHPDAATAARLHAAHPELYPDANDKAELILALTPFEALDGFRTAEEVRGELERHAALRPWLKVWQNGADATNLRGCCAALFAWEEAEMRAALAELAEAVGDGGSDSDRLFLRLLSEHPGDRGTLFAYVLCHVRLAPGEGLFLAPNTPHAYLHGVGLECMSNSDNVIRAGLTPKAVDVPTLLATVDFSRHGAMPLPRHERAAGAGRISRYTPPTPNFEVSLLRDAALHLRAEEAVPGVALVLEGTALVRDAAGERPAPRGSAWFRAASLAEGEIAPSADGCLLAWAAPRRVP